MVVRKWKDQAIVILLPGRVAEEDINAFYKPKMKINAEVLRCLLAGHISNCGAICVSKGGYTGCGLYARRCIKGKMR